MDVRAETSGRMPYLTFELRFPDFVMRDSLFYCYNSKTYSSCILLLALLLCDCFCFVVCVVLWVIAVNNMRFTKIKKLRPIIMDVKFKIQS